MSQTKWDLLRENQHQNSTVQYRVLRRAKLEYKSPATDKVYPFCGEEFQLRKQKETKTEGELALPRSRHQESRRLALAGCEI